MTILLLEDDLELGTALQKALERSDYTTRWVRLTSAAKDVLSNEVCAMAVLDITVPDGSGLTLLKWMRERQLQLPVMMLTAHGDVADRVHALDNGADDYLSKPFAFEEFLSRVRALIRRGVGFASARRRFGTLELCLEQRRAWSDGAELPLTRSEFGVLLALTGQCGRVLTRAQLERATAMFASAESNSLEVHIHHLRKKIGASAIRTVRGVGYVFDMPPSHGD